MLVPLSDSRHWSSTSCFYATALVLRLRQVPGFSLFRRSSSVVAKPTTQGVSLRAIGSSGASRTLVLWDGIPINDPFGGWVYWTRIDPAHIDRVEIDRGKTRHSSCTNSSSTLFALGIRAFSLQFDDDLNQFKLPGYASLQLTAEQRVRKSLSACRCRELVGLAISRGADAVC